MKNVLILFAATFFLNTNASADNDPIPSETVVMFDVGRVLSGDLLGAVRKDLISRYFNPDLGVNKRDFEKKLEAAQTKYRDLADQGQITDQEFWRKALKDVGVEFPRQSQRSFINYLEGKVTCFGDILDVARKLKAAGFRLAILTNDSLEMAQARINACGFRDVFDKKNIFISAKIAKNKREPKDFIKPQQGIYTYALDKLQVSGEDVYFIDDKDYNIEGGAKVGIHGIFFKSNDEALTDRDLAKANQERLIQMLLAQGISLN